MHFTLLFKNFTLSASFAPCLVWTTNFSTQPNSDEWVPHHDSPHYRKGDLIQALMHYGLDSAVENSQDKIIIIVHESNHDGEQADLDCLFEDCSSMNRNVQVISPWDPQDPMYKYLFMNRMGAAQE